MVSKRIWNVRLNVDAFNAAIIGLENDAERLAFLSGFHGGLNGKQKSDKCDAWLSGWSIADQCLAEAKLFSDKQRQRVEKRYRGSTVVTPRNYHGTTVDLPNEQSNNLQSTIYKRTNEIDPAGPEIIPEEQNITKPENTKYIPVNKTKLGIMELKTIPYLKLKPDDNPTWIDCLNSVGVKILTQAAKTVAERSETCWCSVVVPVAFEIKRKIEADASAAEVEQLPDDLSTLPDGHPMKNWGKRI